MRGRFGRKPTLLIVTTSVMVLLLGLAVALTMHGGSGRTAHATPAQGFIDIFNGTDLFACVNPPASGAFGCTPSPQLRNVCQSRGNDTIVCTVQEPSHSGGKFSFDNYVPCFDFTPQGVVEAKSSDVAYFPDGKVVISCTFFN